MSLVQVAPHSYTSGKNQVMPSRHQPSNFQYLTMQYQNGVKYLSLSDQTDYPLKAPYDLKGSEPSMQVLHLSKI